MWVARTAALAFIVFLGACAPLPQRAGIPTRWLPSPNHDERRPNFVIIHHTGGDDAEHSLRTLTNPARAVSAHYLIGRDGTIWQLVDERARAWHAGDSYWAGVTDLNSASLGIELDNDGEEPFADAQIAALLSLLRDITARDRIPATNILGHGDIAPGRKVDPSRYFPWRRLAQQGFGSWCDPPYGTEASSTQSSEAPSEPASVVPASPSPEALALLQAIGYDLRDPDAAIAAFRRHYRGDDSGALAPEDIALLRCLARIKAE